MASLESAIDDTFKEMQQHYFSWIEMEGKTNRLPKGKFGTGQLEL
jgi:hypothetical protein